jgi:hypothetical protein
MMCVCLIFAQSDFEQPQIMVYGFFVGAGVGVGWLAGVC